jgi:glycosyltransferase involved in cell wall biosynthesis
MLKKPFLSIIIPTLNEEIALPLLLSDLASQTTDNFEVIVVDGHSTDKTITKAKKFTSTLPKLTLLTSDKKNVSHQRNQGGKAAEGRYLLFIDADSRLPNYYLEGINYRIHSSKPDLFTSWCLPDSNSPSDKTIATILNIGIEAGNLADNPYAQGTMIGCSKKAFAHSKGYNPQIPFAEDAEFINRCFKLGHNFQIFKDPRYIMSLRRFRKNGKIRAIQQYASLHLKRLTQQKINQKKEYPMGGSAYLGDKNTQSFFESIDQALKNITKKPKVFAKIRSIISLEE